MKLPAKMRYVDHGQGGGPEVMRIVEGDLPEIGSHDVLIRVDFAGVNRPDLLQRAGEYPPPRGASPILGLEVAGGIAALGSEVTTWRAGDQVCALVPGGGYAEYCRTDASHCLADVGVRPSQGCYLQDISFLRGRRSPSINGKRRAHR